MEDLGLLARSVMKQVPASLCAAIGRCLSGLIALNSSASNSLSIDCGSEGTVPLGVILSNLVVSGGLSAHLVALVAHLSGRLCRWVWAIDILLTTLV